MANGLPFTEGDAVDTTDQTDSSTTAADDGSPDGSNSILSDLVNSAGGILTGAANLTSALTGKGGSYTAGGQYIPAGSGTTPVNVVPPAKNYTLYFLAAGAALLLVLLLVFKGA